MVVLVHISSEEKLKSIRSSGIKAGKDSGIVFFMPVLKEYLISHQWARELKRTGIKNFIAVYFKLNSNEEVWFGKYSEKHKKMPLNSAIEEFQKADNKLGYEFFINRKIESKEIKKIRHITKPMGWRYKPQAHGNAPCPCPMCIQKGGFKTNILKEKYNKKMIKEEANIESGKKADVVQVAKLLLVNKVSFLKGVRSISELCIDEDESSHLFTLFEEIDELTFHIPEESDKDESNIYSSSWLVKTEQELILIEKKFRVKVNKNCEELIENFKKT